MKYAYDKLDFEEMTIDINGDTITGLFSDCRVKPETVPEDKGVYYIRHDDEGEPATLETHVLVDFYGIFIVDKNMGSDWFAKHSQTDAHFDPWVDLDSDDVEISYAQPVNELDNLLLIYKFKGIPKDLRMQLFHYNPDSNLGGQIVVETIIMFSYELKDILRKSKTPDDFISSISDVAYKTELIDKGTTDFETLLPILKRSFNGELTKEDKETLGTFDHYITIGTEPTNDPDEYLLSIYAALDRMRLFD